MNAFALCDLCHDNGPFYCCFSPCHTCGDTANYCLSCWHKWIRMCEQQGRPHANCPHCRADLSDQAVHDLMGRPYNDDGNDPSCRLTTITEEGADASVEVILNQDFLTALRDLDSNSRGRCCCGTSTGCTYCRRRPTTTHATDDARVLQTLGSSSSNNNNNSNNNRPGHSGYREAISGPVVQSPTRRKRKSNRPSLLARIRRGARRRYD